MKQYIYRFLCRILRFFTKFYLWRTRPFIIGITGSVGKTTCRDIIFQVLSQVQNSKKVYTSPKNYNSELGLVFSIFCIEEYTSSIRNLLCITLKILWRSIFSQKKYDILIAEYGIDSSGDMDFLVSVMKPDIGIITKLDAVHSQNFSGGLQEYWQDKAKLLLATKHKKYYPGNDAFLQKQKYLFGENICETSVQDTPVKFKKQDGYIVQYFEYQKKQISINLIGNENVEYTKIALDIVRDLQGEIGNASYDFEFYLQPGRFSVFHNSKAVFIDSSYNASPESMKLVIENTKMFQKQLYPEYQMMYVLGDMRELGDLSQKAHRDVASQIIDSTAIFTVGPEMYKWLIPELQRQEYIGITHSSLSSREIGKNVKKYISQNTFSQYLVLFKGSQNTIFMEEALAIQLPVSQRKNLVRQTQDWKKKKEGFFKSL